MEVSQYLYFKHIQSTRCLRRETIEYPHVIVITAGEAEVMDLNQGKVLNSVKNENSWTLDVLKQSPNDKHMVWSPWFNKAPTNGRSRWPWSSLWSYSVIGCLRVSNTWLRIISCIQLPRCILTPPVFPDGTCPGEHLSTRRACAQLSPTHSSYVPLLPFPLSESLVAFWPFSFFLFFQLLL